MPRASFAVEIYAKEKNLQQTRRPMIYTGQCQAKASLLIWHQVLTEVFEPVMTKAPEQKRSIRALNSLCKRSTASGSVS